MLLGIAGVPAAPQRAILQLAEVSTRDGELEDDDLQFYGPEVRCPNTT